MTVIPDNARTPEYRAKLEQWLAQGECPFCNNTMNQEIIASSGFWYVTLNANPLENVIEHFMIIPNRHVESMYELNDEEWGDLKNALEAMEYTFLGDKVYYWRDGDKLKSGGTVQHLHLQGIIPSGERVLVKFGGK